MIFFHVTTVRVTSEVSILRNVFNCAVHESYTPSKHLLDPDFYETGPEQALPVGLHYELELLDSWVWCHDHKDNIHIRTSKLNGKKFVCIPKRIHSLISEAARLFWIWSVGTAFTLTDPRGRDFQDICPAGEDFEEFRRRMQHAHGIRVTNFRIHEGR